MKCFIILSAGKHTSLVCDTRLLNSVTVKMKCFIILSAGKHTSLICDTRLLNSVTVKMRNEGLKIKFTCCGNA